MTPVGSPTLVDRIVEQNQDLVTAAIKFAGTVAAKPIARTSDLDIPPIESPQHYFDQWRSRLAKKARGQTAPQKAIQAVENALVMPFAEAMVKERELFLECRSSPQSAAMRHAFFAERQSRKIEDIKPGIKPAEIKKVAVIGAGTMGCGIAICFASAGFDVCLLEINRESLEQGLDNIRNRYQASVDRGRIDQHSMDKNLGRIRGTCDYADLSHTDLVVEAAFESMEVKKSIFSQLDRHCKPEAILATNTSYLNLDEIAAATESPQRILGMHFFSPADVMKLLEVVRGAATDDQTLSSVMAVAKKIGKIAVAVGVCYGFAGNRMYSAYGAEANALLLEGASPNQVDSAMEAWGWQWDPSLSQISPG